MKASEIISKNIPQLHAGDTGAAALHLMSEFHVRHLPVTDQRHFIGIISEDDILAHHAIEEPIASLLPGSPAFVPPHEHIFEVMKVAIQQQLTLIPVADDEENYLGSITREDLLRYFTVETDLLQPGGIMVIEVATIDYTLAEVAHIIEEHHARILCAFVKTLKENDKMELTIKVNQTELQPIINTLQRYNYFVKQTFTEPEYIDNLKERYDSLMNYLNI